MLPREVETIPSVVSMPDYFAFAFWCGSGWPRVAESRAAAPAHAAGAANRGCM